MSEDTYREKAFAGHVLYTVSGSKDVVMTRAVPWRDYLAPNTTLKAARAALQSMDEPTLSRFKQVSGATTEVFGGVVTKGDFLYVPAGFFISEKIHTSNYMCVRFGVLSTSLSMTADLRALESWGDDAGTKALRVHMESVLQARA